MSKLICFLVISALGWSGGSKDNEGSLKIVIKNIQSDEGEILLGMCATRESFSDKDQSDLEGKASIQDGVAVLEFDNIPFGDYAAKVFHDENKNGKMDFNILGIPKESYGFSNNPHAFGFPSFERAAFKMDEPEKTIVIFLK